MNVSPENSKYLSWLKNAQARLAAGEEVEIGGHLIQQMKAGKAQTPYCIHKDAVPAVRAAVEAFGKAEDAAQGAPSWVEKATGGEKKGIDPNAPHIRERTGMKRDKTDE